ncbi:MAG: 7-cyano-7-deazaguanine synthase QueC [Candidatus Omnitrophota bacterium]
MQVSRSKKYKRKALVLLSGGIDSATTLYLARKKFCPTALMFDYGQRHKKEIESAKKIARIAHCQYKIVKLALPRKGNALLDRKAHVPVRRSLKEIKRTLPLTYVPARNLVFLSIASSFAESMKTKAVFIGCHSQDYPGYPDCRKAFFDIFRKVITAGTKYGRRIKIYAPLLDKKKSEIIKIALRLKVPIELTWSCYKGGRHPCGICDSCFFRRRAFEELNMEDPYYV